MIPGTVPASTLLPPEGLPPCPVATTLRLLGNKWKIFIMQRLLERSWRFNELQKSIPGISQKVLTENLRAMEEDALVLRTVYPEVPPRVEYKLSPVGESMAPIIQAMYDWGEWYQSQSRQFFSAP